MRKTRKNNQEKLQEKGGEERAVRRCKEEDSTWNWPACGVLTFHFLYGEGSRRADEASKEDGQYQRRFYH